MAVMKVQEKAGKMKKEGTLVRAVMKNIKGKTNRRFKNLYKSRTAMTTGQLRSGAKFRTKPKERERRRLMRTR